MSNLSILEGAPEGILHILLPDDEIDLAIADAGCRATVTMPVERMRSIVADISMAVSNAIAADDAEFELSIRALEPLASAEERDFAARYHDHLLGEVRSLPFAEALELASIGDRIALVKARVTGAKVLPVQ